MFGFHRTGVTATASTQSGICTDVSGDTWLDESRRTDAAATTRSATTARGRDAMCESASTVHAIKESVNGRHQDGIRRDGYQGAVTMAVLGTNYAGSGVRVVRLRTLRLRHTRCRHVWRGID